MPRKNRIHYRHAFYHVMLRGNYRQNIFLADDDFQSFLNILEKAANSFCCDIHLFCLMTNHVHLVIEVQDVPVSKIMQLICSSYAKYHNKKYDKSGHLFQGRFKSKIIQDDHYLLELCYYIHMNPLKAGICHSLDDYRWSSHHYYSGKTYAAIVNGNHMHKLLSQFALADNSNAYINFITHFKNQNLSPVFCTFNEDGHLIIQDSVILKMQNTPSLALENLPLRKIIDIVCDYFHITPDKLSTGSKVRCLTLARSMIAYFAHYHAKYSLIDIAAYFCMQPNSLSRTLHRNLRLAKTCQETQRIMNALERRLSISDTTNLVS